MRTAVVSILLTTSLAEAFVVRRPRPLSLVVQRQSALLRTVTAPAASVDVNVDDKHDVEELEASEPDKKFDWYKAWYPLVPVEMLDKEVPHQFDLLGMKVVVWHDGKVGDFGSKKKRKKGKQQRSGGEWRAFVDECPHRKVPLSEGRVEDDGSLLCSYHGWRFNGTGNLVAAPQLDDESDAMQRLVNNPKSRCNAFPVQVINGVLWVWPETGDNARLEAALKPAAAYHAIENEEEESDRLWYGPWNYCELPYSADYFLENVVDPAHVSVSHHNVIGSRYNDQRITLSKSSALTKDGFKVTVQRPGTTEEFTPESTSEYVAPGTVAIESSYDDGALQALELYISPARPGFSNHVGRMVIVKPPGSSKMPALLKQFTLPLPKWVNHIMARYFLNQDALFLHHQERHLARTGLYTAVRSDEGKNATTLEQEADHYTKAILPINSDQGVVTFRNWLRLLAGGRIPYKYNPQLPLENENNDVVFDVWNSHTKHCQICQGALANLKKARLTSFALAVVLAVLRPAKAKVASTAGVLALAGVGVVLNKLIGLFYRAEFSHAQND